MGVGVLGAGHYAPDNIVTNKDLEKIVDTTDEWIRTRTGIEERRLAKEDEDSSDMAYEASKKALKDAGVEASELDMIIVATVTPDTPFPSVACMIQDKLGANNAAAMDVGAACAGFMYAMITAQQFLETGSYKRILIVGVDKLSKIIDWNDRNTCVLLGDGAGAAVMGEVSDGRGILSFELGSDGSKGKELYQNEHGFMYMNGREVFKFAVRQMPNSSEKVIEKAGLKKDDVDFLVPHPILELWKQRENVSEYLRRRWLSPFINMVIIHLLRFQLHFQNHFHKGKFKMMM